MENCTHLSEGKLGYVTCPHGQSKCVGHSGDFKYENLELPNPSFLGLYKCLFFRHCGRAMLRYKIIQVQTCKICDRKVVNDTFERFALCSCCGHRVDTTQRECD